MLIENICKIVALVILSAGGIGGVIWYVSKGLSKMLFEKYMENIKHKYDKELEEIKHSYELELNKIKAKLDNITYISNLQYEKEFQIYIEVFEKIYTVIENARKLYYSTYKNNFSKDVFFDLSNSVNEYSCLVMRYKPFIDCEIWIALEDINKYLRECILSFDEDLDQQLKKQIKKMISNLDQMYNACSLKTQGYFKNLKTIY